MTKLLVMYSHQPPTGQHLDNLQSLTQGVIEVATSEETAIRAAPEVEVILGQRYLRQTLPWTERLHWIQSTQAGVDNLLTAALYDKQPLLTRCPIFSDVVAWHAFSMALAITRRIPEASIAQQAGQWSKPFSMLAAPRSAVIVGLGSIGKELAQFLRRQQIRVIGVVRDPRPLDGYCDEVVRLEDWHDALSRADWCFLSIPNLPENKNLFDSQAIASLPQHAVLVNVGRSQTLDTNALIEHLQSGHLGGAALDVLNPTPEPSHPIWTTPRLLITPHVSSFFPRRQERLEAFVEDQVSRFLAGIGPRHRVDYRRP